MNNRSGPRVRFDPEVALVAAISDSAQRSWLQVPVLDQAVEPAQWSTRAARGLSWHRAGRVRSRLRGR